MRDHMKLHPEAAPTSENSTNYHYMVAGYHQLHCLHVVRDSIYYLNGTLSEWHGEGGFLWDHVLHCVEAIRQALQCSLDPTLIPLENSWPGIPNGQMHICRNSEALRKWTAKYSYPKPTFTRQQEQPHTQEWIEKMKLAGQI
ncbi:hypothetical protein BGW36DRAFT_353856 [Talaromyces proteolyticus]|uniref:Uncharacterized protein n=1 Tax=Talaromyces proteolyticus TaxID=1131652 RepID=A0AAD4L1K1_9EURO|nr:uncharacterized protein BGW36DRAFT_353856 [Talaromyces proteolyticus]KAH8705449.1 hypothetical protein BGW36DRAFT_353856 [Talaromyces proteolyticus]